MHMAYCKTVNSSPMELTSGITYLGIHCNILKGNPNCRASDVRTVYFQGLEGESTRSSESKNGF